MALIPTSQSAFWRQRAEYLRDIGGVMIAFFAVCILFSLLNRAFFSSNNIITVLRQAGLNSIVAFGMTLVIISGGIDLSVGGVMCLSGLVAAVSYVNWGVGIVPMILIALLVGILFGLVNGLIIAFVDLPPFIVTLGMQLAAFGLAGIVTNNKPVQLMVDEFNNLALEKVGEIPVMIFYMIFFLLVSMFVLDRTKFGRYIYAVGGNAVTAVYSGINVKLIKIIVYVISGAMASLTGVLTAAKLYSGQPSVGTNAEIDAISAVVIGGAAFSGGKGNAIGTVIGVMFICIVSNGLNMLGVSTFWQKVANGMIIIFAVSLDKLKKKR